MNETNITYKIHNCKQRSDKWHSLRLGKITSSDATQLRVNGKGLDTLTDQKVSELILNGSDQEQFVSEAMQNGIDLEKEALDRYKQRTCTQVQEVGFVEKDNFNGSSPDGLVNDNGLVEIKCPLAKTAINYILKEIPTKYIDQMQHQMWICNRAWCDFVVYCPSIQHKNGLFIKRIHRDEGIIEKFESHSIKAKDQIMKKLRSFSNIVIKNNGDWK